MVRTRGLGRALGWVIGRAVGRQDDHDSDDVPQRRRPIASACRQREAAHVAKDAPEMTKDVAAPSAEAPDDGEGSPIDDAEGFPGGPRDPSVLTEFADHVAVSIWNGEECPKLKLASHRRKVEKFERSTPKIEGLVAATRLTPLIVCSIDTGDRGVISTFVERWHKKTSSFHLPVGELTITLDDVASLLHLPIIGAFHSFELLHVDEAMIMDRQLAGYITLLQCWIYEHFPSVHESVTDEKYDETSPRACQWLTMKAYSKGFPASTYQTRIDALTIPDVCWMPYGEHRGVRAFDLISCFQGELR
ncbi:uncharacterized protein LOC114420401 [Glycine soja]|uniref:uncharacterized protein LOC114420401 n=1 Tax=Glycine soja TaxID=3848 RepID=UPI00103FE369|nr:uncharacterized protein LOC114420401 [Glycine soja]